MQETSIIIGASTGLGRALASQLGAKGNNLLLVSSSLEDLIPLKSDLTIQYGITAVICGIDISSCLVEKIVQEAVNNFDKIDNLFVIAGVSDPKLNGPLSTYDLDRLMTVNFTAPVRIINSFLPLLADNPKANIIGAGSVVAIRPRKNNAVYGAAKCGLEFYFGTIRHWLASGHVCNVQFYRLGYMKTQMTFDQQLPFPAISPCDAAQEIISNLGKDCGVQYLPKWWGAIAILLKLVPWRVFRRLDV